MKAGDHLISSRGVYTHHGIYAGRDKVIHYAGFSEAFKKGEIEKTSLNKFRNGNDITVKSHPDRKYDHRTSVERAKQKIGEDRYNLFLIIVSIS